MTLPILALTSAEYEQWCPQMYRLLDEFWPGHPPVCFVSEKKRIPGCATLVVRSGNWIYRLQQGVRHIRRVYPHARYAMIILEEMFPLHEFDTHKVLSIAATAAKKGFNCVAFNAGGTYKGWKRVRAGGHTFLKTPRSYYYYNQNSAGIWKVAHLEEVCRIARAKRFHSGWQFERVVTSGHYVASFPWPNVPNGIFYRSWVNAHALPVIQLPQGERLKHKLIQCYRRQQLGDDFARSRSKAEMKHLMSALGAVSDPLVVRAMALLRRSPSAAPALAKALGAGEKALMERLGPLITMQLVVPDGKGRRTRWRINRFSDKGSTCAQVVELACSLGRMG